MAETDEDDEVDDITRTILKWETSGSDKDIDTMKKELRVMRHDLILLRLIFVGILTLSFLMLFMQMSRRDVSAYEKLQSILEEMETLTVDELPYVYVHKSYKWSTFEESEHWAWDSQRETLKVNTSFYVH